MKTTIVLFSACFLFSACSNYTLNGEICDKVNIDQRPGAMPNRCEQYSQEKADRALAAGSDKNKTIPKSDLELENSAK